MRFDGHASPKFPVVADQTDVGSEIVPLPVITIPRQERYDERLAQIRGLIGFDGHRRVVAPGIDEPVRRIWIFDLKGCLEAIPVGCIPTSILIHKPFFTFDDRICHYGYGIEYGPIEGLDGISRFLDLIDPFIADRQRQQILTLCGKTPQPRDGEIVSVGVLNPRENRNPVRVKRRKGNIGGEFDDGIMTGQRPGKRIAPFFLNHHISGRNRGRIQNTGKRKANRGIRREASLI